MYKFINTNDVNKFIAEYWIEKCNSGIPYISISKYRDTAIQKYCNELGSEFLYKIIKGCLATEEVKSVYTNWFYFDINVLIEISKKM